MYAKVFEVLLDESPLGVNEIARRIGRPVASVHKYLTKDTSGQFTRTTDRKWILTSIATDWPDKEDKELVEGWLKEKDLTSILKYIKELQEISSIAEIKIKYLRAHAGSQLYREHKVMKPESKKESESKKEQPKSRYNREAAIDEIIKRLGRDEEIEKGIIAECEKMDDAALKENLKAVRDRHKELAEATTIFGGQTHEDFYDMKSDQFTPISGLEDE